eukprot:1931722-Amphidinium_carterae.1
MSTWSEDTTVISVAPMDPDEFLIEGESAGGTLHVIQNGAALHAMTQAHVEQHNALARWRQRPAPRTSFYDDDRADYTPDINVVRVLLWQLAGPRQHVFYTPPEFDEIHPAFSAGGTHGSSPKSAVTSGMGYTPRTAGTSRAALAEDCTPLECEEDCVAVYLPDMEVLRFDGFSTCSYASSSSHGDTETASIRARPVHSISTSPTSSMGYNPLILPQFVNGEERTGKLEV